MKTKQKIIYSSKDYSKFVQDDTNRSAEKHPKLLESMQTYGWLPEHPAVVFPDSGKFRIKDGGHRIQHAQKLGLPVFYVISDNDDVSIAQINEAQKRWTNRDFISSFIKQGKTEYAKLVAFSDAHGLPVGICAALLCGSSSGSSAIIRSGKFKVTNATHAENVVAVVNAASKVAKYSSHACFVGAVSSILKYSQANVKTLCDKIRSHGGMLIPQSSTEGYIEVLQNVYNYKSREIMGIALAVKQSVRAQQKATICKHNSTKK